MSASPAKTMVFFDGSVKTIDSNDLHLQSWEDFVQSVRHLFELSASTSLYLEFACDQAVEGSDLAALSPSSPLSDTSSVSPFSSPLSSSPLSASPPSCFSPLLLVPTATMTSQSLQQMAGSFSSVVTPDVESPERRRRLPMTSEETFALFKKWASEANIELYVSAASKQVRGAPVLSLIPKSLIFHPVTPLTLPLFQQNLDLSPLFLRYVKSLLRKHQIEPTFAPLSSTSTTTSSSSSPSPSSSSSSSTFPSSSASLLSTTSFPLSASSSPYSAYSPSPTSSSLSSPFSSPSPAFSPYVSPAVSPSLSPPSPPSSPPLASAIAATGPPASTLQLLPPLPSSFSPSSSSSLSPSSSSFLSTPITSTTTGLTPTSDTPKKTLSTSATTATIATTTRGTAYSSEVSDPTVTLSTTSPSTLPIASSPSPALSGSSALGGDGKAEEQEKARKEPRVKITFSQDGVTRREEEGSQTRSAANSKAGDNDKAVASYLESAQASHPDAQQQPQQQQPQHHHLQQQQQQQQPPQEQDEGSAVQRQAEALGLSAARDKNNGQATKRAGGRQQRSTSQLNKEGRGGRNSSSSPSPSSTAGRHSGASSFWSGFNEKNVQRFFELVQSVLDNPDTTFGQEEEPSFVVLMAQLSHVLNEHEKAILRAADRLHLAFQTCQELGFPVSERALLLLYYYKHEEDLGKTIRALLQMAAQKQQKKPSAATSSPSSSTTTSSSSSSSSTTTSTATSTAASSSSTSATSAVPQLNALLARGQELVKVKCHGCEKEIQSDDIRYKCGHCPSYDLCTECESNNLHNPTHIFLKIRPVAQLAQGALPTEFPMLSNRLRMLRTKTGILRSAKRAGASASASQVGQ